MTYYKIKLITYNFSDRDILLTFTKHNYVQWFDLWIRKNTCLLIDISVYTFNKITKILVFVLHEARIKSMHILSNTENVLLKKFTVKIKFIRFFFWIIVMIRWEDIFSIRVFFLNLDFSKTFHYFVETGFEYQAVTFFLSLYFLRTVCIFRLWIRPKWNMRRTSNWWMSPYEVFFFEVFGLPSAVTFLEQK